MDTWSANQHRYSRGLRRIVNHEEHEGTRSRMLFLVSFVSFVVIARVTHIERSARRHPDLRRRKRWSSLHTIMEKTTYPTLSVSKAQSGLPKLCRNKKAILITTHEKPISVLLPIEDYQALIETMDLLANPTAMRTLRAAKAGKLKYRRLNLGDENFGL
jgi:PHD/YefM family antitoxin component YafN of YafNO toxin-antitoxin module